MEESLCYYCHGSGEDELDEMGKCKPCGGKGFERPEGIARQRNPNELIADKNNLN